nr:ABC transporter permease [Cellulomonas denverensis]
MISIVIAMVALLVTFLSSLTAGLAHASTSAVTGLPADRLAFGMPSPEDAVDFTSSRVTEEQWTGWATVPGVTAAEPLGVVTTRAGSDATTMAVTALGAEPGSSLVPGGAPGAGDVVLTRPAAEDLAVGTGDSLTLNGVTLTVGRIADRDDQLAHTPAVWLSLPDWQRVGAGGDAVATVVALRTDGSVDLAAADAEFGTSTVTTQDARSAVASYQAENLSLTTIQVFLMAISALVVGAFFTVWTIGRQGDIAVLKALGASDRYLLRDAVGQAALLLIGAVALGAGLAALLGTVLSGALPVVVSPSTTLLPAGVLIVVGLLGAAVAVARIARTDPHAALAAR